MSCKSLTVKMSRKIRQYLERDLDRVIRMGDITVPLHTDENDLGGRETPMTHEREEILAHMY